MPLFLSPPPPSATLPHVISSDGDRITSTLSYYRDHVLPVGEQPAAAAAKAAVAIVETVAPAGIQLCHEFQPRLI